MRLTLVAAGSRGGCVSKVEVLKESETRLEHRLRTLVSCMADPGFFRSLATDSKKEVSPSLCVSLTLGLSPKV